MQIESDEQFVAWFRSVAPYFRAFRDRTFVIGFGGEVAAEGKFASLAHDINLLHSAGIRLVLVHGSRPQIEAQLKAHKVRSKYKNGVRVTDPVSLECVKEAVGVLRVEIEALLSQGLPNSPMAGAAINTVSGNFITAQPYGVHGGVDFQYTGAVRKVDTAAIRACLDAGNIVIISNVGYSPTGEVFNLSIEDVAMATARALVADKLIFLTDEPVMDDDGELIAELSAQDADRLLADGKRLSSDTRLYLQHATEAVRGGVPRAHLVSHKVDGSLLMELFTREGSGSMLTADKL
jgi:amino-acid N-acetyltransferase